MRANDVNSHHSSLVAAVTSRTGKIIRIIKMALVFLKKERNFVC